MKKLSKILILVLSLALVLGSIMVVTSAADVAGFSEKRNQNFDGVTASSSSPWNIQNWDAVMGTKEVVKDTFNNSYYLFKISGTSGSKDLYFGGGYQNGWCGGSAAWSYKADTETWTAGKHDARTNPYFIYQIDVMSPTGEFTDPTINAQYRWPKTATGAGNGMNDSKTSFGIITDDTGSYVKVGENKITINPYAFTNITVIMKAVFPDDTSAFQSEMHVYVDGVYAGKLVSTFSTYYAVNGKTNFSWEDVRLMPVAKATKFDNASLAVDNMKFYLVSSSYANLATLDALTAGGANLKDNTTWTENVYTGTVPFGTPIVKVGETTYDSIEKAQAAMASLDYVTAEMVNTIEVTFNKIGKVYYTTEAQKDAIKLAPGFGLKDPATDDIGTYVEIVEANSLNVHFDYHYGDACCADASSHILAKDSSVAVGFEVMSGLTGIKYDIDENGLIGLFYNEKTGALLQHTGWKYLVSETTLDPDTYLPVTTWTLGEDFVAGTKVTDLLAAKQDIYLVPVFEEPSAEALQGKLYMTIEDGVVKFFDSTYTLKDVFAATGSKATIKLLGDVAYDANKNGTIPAGGRTLDVNGYTFDARNDAKYGTSDNENKKNVFNSPAGFTVTSTRVGGKIFTGGTRLASSSRVMGPFISGTGDVSFVAPGIEYLSYYGGTPYQNWSGYAQNFLVDGVAFYGTLDDNTGFFHLTTVKNAVIKNSLIVTKHGATIYVSGRSQQNNTSSVLVDNCIFIADGGAIVQHSYDKATILFTNCYLDGNINAKNSYGDIPKGQITIGAGNYIGGELGTGVVFADGVVKYDVNSYFKISYKYNQYKPNPNFETSNAYDEDLVLFDKTTISDYTAYTGAADLADVKVNLKEGETVVGTNTIKVGMIPSGAGEKATAVEGWVDYTNIWAANYGDEAATAEVTVENPDKTYVQAFDLPIYYQYHWTDHLGFAAFYPVAPEGIEYKDVYFQADTSRISTSAATFMIDGVEYDDMRGNWDGVAKYVAGKTITLIYTYAGQEFTYVTPSIKLGDYLATVVANEGDKYSKEDVEFAYGLAEYATAYLTATAAEATVLDPIKAIADASTLALPAGFGETAYTATDLSQYMSLSFAIAGGRVRIQATLKEAYAGHKIAFVTDKDAAELETLVTISASEGLVAKSGDYCFYNLAGDFDVVVLDSEGKVVASADNYNLSYYAAAVKEDATAYATVCAIYKYGVAQKALRDAHGVK